MEMNRLSITMNGVTKCSGSCRYCLAAHNYNYSLGIDNNTIIESCKKVDEITAEQCNWDWDNLKKVLDERKPSVVDIWGADPVTCFTNLKKLVEFLERLKYIKIISASTNGYPLLRDDVTNYIIKHKLYIQLSHDGLGQHVRTREIDPLDFENVRKLMRAGLLNAINCTLTQYNWSLFQNMEYFNNKLKEIFPEVWDPNTMASKELSDTYRKLYIKLNHIMDGDYDIPGLGDVSIHNDENNHVLDNYMLDWDVYFEKWRSKRINTLEYVPFNKYLTDQFKRGSSITDDSCNECRKFQIGHTNISTHIDTLGKDCDCNLQDSDHPVPNRENKRPEYCNNCQFKNSGECNMCGAVMPRKSCQYLYRWNQFLLKTRGVLYGKSSINTQAK